MVQATCTFCGKKFQVFPSKLKQERCYCSRFCQHKALVRRVKLSCQCCGVVFEVPPSSVKNGRRFCGKKCEWKSRPVIPPEKRFFRRVNKNGPIPQHKPELGPCWIWMGCRDENGYGHMGGERKRNAAVHRFSYELHIGQIPDGLFVCHHCDNPPCVNPAHLFVGDCLANAQDAAMKGRMPRGEKHKDTPFNDGQVVEIRRLVAGGKSQASIAREFNVSTMTIWQIVHGWSWRHLLCP